MNPGLKILRSITWDEVFSLWEKVEADLQHWIEHYKSGGFNSWKDWRNHSIKDLNLNKLKWNLYEIPEPLGTVPNFHMSPFRAWIKKYNKGNNALTFKELALVPEIQLKANVDKIAENFPKNSTLIGLIHNSNIIIIEGLHRCCALSVAKQNGINIQTKLFIACAEFHEELPLIGQENSPT